MDIKNYNVKLEKGSCLIRLSHKKIKFIKIMLNDFVLEDNDYLYIYELDEYNIEYGYHKYDKKKICNINPYIYEDKNMDECKNNNKEILISYSTHLNEINTGYYKPQTEFLEFKFLTKKSITSNYEQYYEKVNAIGDVLIKICYET